VLYTPTFRDDSVFAERPFELGLDTDAFAAALGSDHVLLLRLHYLVREELPPPTHAAVRDVSSHPDVSELYLAADVLVTDYSSSMFDFAVTGRPIAFLAYDLEDFQHRVRGFYFDLADEAPGPLVDTTEELVGVLRDLEGVRTRYAERYARFRERYCHLEDGRATDRVVGRLGVGATIK
jgi:CDP-glycerol glycerophosphotransferase